MNRISGEGVFHRWVWPLERFIVKHLMLRPRALVEEGLDHGIDFIAVTDHNLLTAVDSGDPLSLHMIPAEEWGQRKGHASLLFINRSVDPDDGYFEGKLPETVLDFHHAATAVREMGGFIVVNHPFKRDLWLWGDGSYDLVDAIEVWNGAWNQENQKALDFWQKSMVDGHRLFATAASDFHVRRMFRIDSPVVAVEDTFSLADIERKLRTGDFSLALDTGAPVAFISSGSPPEYHIEHNTTGITMRVVTESSVSEIMNPEDSGSLAGYEFGRFIRIELWSGDSPLCFSNPLFSR